MSNYKTRYQELESDVHARLKHLIQREGLQSKHGQFRAIHAGIGDYHELAMIDYKLMFVDDRGHYYSVDCDVTLEDLIDIVERYK